MVPSVFAVDADVIRDDYDQVDVDSPIPYTLTPKGRRDLAAALLEEAVQRCTHEWLPDIALGVVCRRCGEVARPRKTQSIPAYLGLRDRK